MASTARAWGRALLALMTMCAILVTSGVANAEPPYTTTATIENLKFTEGTVTAGRSAELTGTWSLPDDPKSPAGFVVGLPAALSGAPDKFNLTSPSGDTVGSCTVTNTQLNCDFNEAYLAANPKGLSGTFNFWVRVDENITKTTEKTYTFDNVNGSTTVTVAPGKCTVNCNFTGVQGRKYGYYNASTEGVHWVIEVTAPAEGMTAGQKVTVTDLLPENQRLRENDGIIVSKGTEVATQPDGVDRPNYSSRVPSSALTVTDDPLTIAWTAEQGTFYKIDLWTQTTDSGASGTYTNAAGISVDGQIVKQVSNSVQRQGGGGTGIGTNVGRFKVTKSVEGDAAIPGDTKFTLNYTVTTNGSSSEHTGTVTPSTPFVSPTYPRQAL